MNKMPFTKISSLLLPSYFEPAGESKTTMGEIQGRSSNNNHSRDNEIILVEVGNLIYDPEKIISRGAYGIVFKGFHHEGGQKLAIKRTERIRVREEFVDIIDKQHIFKVSDHPNILRYLCTEKTEDFIYLATELCSGNLQDWIEDKYTGPEIIGGEISILHQVTQGLAHLHENKIIHGNIIPTNVLIQISNNNQPVIKLADFGFCNVVLNHHRHHHKGLRNPLGTEGWIPQELYHRPSGKLLDLFKVDAFMLGILFAYTLTRGKHPFGKDADQQTVAIKGKKPMQLKMKDLKRSPQHSEANLAFKLIQSMLEKDPKDRPTVAAVLKHELFHRITNEYRGNRSNGNEANTSSKMEINKTSYGLSSTSAFLWTFFEGALFGGILVLCLTTTLLQQPYSLLLFLIQATVMCAIIHLVLNPMKSYQLLKKRLQKILRIFG